MGPASVADLRCGRPRLQPSDPSPGGASLSATSPLTGAPQGGLLRPGHHSGSRSENNGRAGSKEVLLPAIPGSRKSLPRKWAPEPPHPGTKAAPGAQDKSLPSRPASTTGAGAGLLRLQTYSCHTYKVWASRRTPIMPLSLWVVLDKIPNL